MKKLIEYPLKDGSLVLIEVEEPDRPPTSTASPMRGIPNSQNDVIERAIQTFDDALDKVKPAAYAIITKLKESKTPPEQIGLEFGIKFSAKAGAAIASTDAEANFKVTMTWKREG